MLEVVLDVAVLVVVLLEWEGTCSMRMHSSMTCIESISAHAKPIRKELYLYALVVCACTASMTCTISISARAKPTWQLQKQIVDSRTNRRHQHSKND